MPLQAALAQGATRRLCSTRDYELSPNAHSRRARAIHCADVALAVRVNSGWISVSRAARLVGVRRGVLQQQIQRGELRTFEGDIRLEDLLDAYPDAEVEDSSMLERVGHIMAEARFSSDADGERLAERSALGARIKAISEELAAQRRRVVQYGDLLDQLVLRLGAPAPTVPGSAAPEHARYDLIDWLDAERARIDDHAASDGPVANEVFLRVMSAQVKLLPSGHEFFIEGADSILEAGLRGGYALNYGCSNGNCGLCKVRVVTGSARRIRHYDHPLTEAEKAQGYVLGCCYTAESDLIVEADEAGSIQEIPEQQIPVRVRKLERPGDDVLVLNARTPRTRRLRFLAGQRAQLSVDHVGERSYPIASCPCDDMNLQFHIPLDDADPLARFLSGSAKLNDMITLTGPAGDFVLDENSPRSLVFVAEGTGFAPIKGLIEHAMALDAAAHLSLVWLTRPGVRPYLANLCRAWNDALDNFSYIPVDSIDPETLTTALDTATGSVTAEGCDYYISASEAVRAQTRNWLEEQAVPATQIHCDD